MERLSYRFQRLMVTSVLLAMLSGCGNGDADSGSNPRTSAGTYSVEITDIELTDTRTGRDIAPDGLPVQGTTVTNDESR